MLLTCSLAALQDLKIVSTVDPPLVGERLFMQIKNDMNHTVDSATFALPLDAGSINVEDHYGELDFSLNKKTEFAELVYRFKNPLEVGEERLVIIEYTTQQVLSKKNSEYEFVMISIPPSDLEIEHTLEIPKGYGLSSKGVISPDAVVSYGTDKTSVVWKVNAKKDKKIIFLARFNEAESKNWWLMVVGVLAAVVLGFGLGLVFQKGKKAIDKKRKLDSVKILTEEDRRLLEDIIESPGINQNEFIEKYNLSKASLSKRVTNLVGRGLLIKKKRGRKNYLYPGPKLN